MGLAQVRRDYILTSHFVAFSEIPLGDDLSSPEAAGLVDPHATLHARLPIVEKVYEGHQDRPFAHPCKLSHAQQQSVGTCLS